MNHRAITKSREAKLSDAVAYEIFEGPYVTEKSAQLGQSNVLVLKVVMRANKIDIKRAFEKIFEIPVEKVRTLITKPKMRLFKGKIATRAAFKKAFISVKKGFDVKKILGVE